GVKTCALPISPAGRLQEPLREDVPHLAERFLEETCRRFGVLPRKLSGEARELVVSYDWRRNNVRELRNVMERMVVTADGEMIKAEHLPPEISGAGPATAGDEPRTFQELQAQAERTIILATLEK